MFTRIFPVLLVLLGGCAFLPYRFAAQSDLTVSAVIEPLRLISASGTFCNSVRLDNRTIATAAHCIEDGQALSVIEAGQEIIATQATKHPAYELTSPERSTGVDLAKLLVPAKDEILKRVPIRPLQPGPVEIRVIETNGTNLFIPCQHLGRSGTIVELSCGVSLGWSGAPVVQDGALVGILSARSSDITANIVQMADAMLLDTF